MEGMFAILFCNDFVNLVARGSDICTMHDTPQQVIVFKRKIDTIATRSSAFAWLNDRYVLLLLYGLRCQGLLDNAVIANILEVAITDAIIDEIGRGVVLVKELWPVGITDLDGARYMLTVDNLPAACLNLVSEGRAAREGAGEVEFDGLSLVVVEEMGGLFLFWTVLMLGGHGLRALPLL
ncbi:hypothetical protein BCR37DRAFT_381321 [Protomyces lactucae-debilis]|uniref:Uncharacterized protein n=1 Tax=Protomyces lactucae-debilis TaxID=2754530 RepID=A0A1Y2F7I3_PROLT|nr:uncharacterized protein BCR37DRAFT_381321 [Protomyces lactucae-debilis]ORY79890.1 hypothetical protein BCR37DRAFT_381321 [Protomyces lactucae-debilis]